MDRGQIGTMVAFSPAHGIEIQVHLIPALVKYLLKQALDHAYATSRPRPFSQNDFKEQFLSDRELDRLNQFKAMKKQIEWLCGRFALKSLGQKFLLPDHGLKDIQIRYMPEGAPFFKAFPDICVSLSHSGIYTGAALAKRSNTRMGIDIEALGPRPDKFFLNTAFTSREIQDMGKAPLDIFCRWTLKEAYLKYIRKGFNKSLLEVEVLQNKIFDQGRDQNLDCRSWELAHDFILSMVSGKNHL